MQQAKQTKWTTEEVQTLQRLHKKRVNMKYVAVILGRTTAACRSKMWQLTHPEYQPKPKPPKEQPHEAVIRNLEVRVQDLEAELKHAQECMQAIHLNMNQFYNYSKG